MNLILYSSSGAKDGRCSKGTFFRLYVPGYNIIRPFGTPLSITLEYFIADATPCTGVMAFFNNDDCIPIFLPHFKRIAYLFRQHGGGDDDVSFAAVFSLP